VLRQRVNPNGERIPGISLRIGDRIIIRENQLLHQGEDPDGKPVFQQVVNGDTGCITACNVDSSNTSIDHLHLQLDDGREIKFPGKKIDALSLAYAKTVHAAQGSEYDLVIFVCTNGSPSFVHRGIVYTAFSRAKSKLMVLADDQTLQRIVKRPIPERNSTLVARTKYLLNKIAAGADHQGKICRASITASRLL
jgi:exodeoxyribonuclease V alpha subunit